jgi:hypothetical protein
MARRDRCPSEIDVIRRAEEEEARCRLPPSSVPTVVDVDALKPVDDL